MDKLLCSFIVLLIATSLSSQQYEQLDGNNIIAGFHSDGLMFSSESQEDAGFFGPFNINGEIPATIFASNIWVAAQTQDNQTFASRQLYYGINDLESYSPGPYNVEALNVDFDKVWKVKGSEIRSFLNDWSDGQLDDIPSNGIMNWPARGNEYLVNFPMQDLAPFRDLNGDGIYNPSKGDYPVIGEDLAHIIPDQILYNIYNDNLNTWDGVGMEVHCIAYSLQCDEEELLNNVIFTRHEIRNMSKEYETFFISLWQDADIGCFTDDYIGCDSLNSIFYNYNQDPIDGSIGDSCTFNIATFSNAPIVQATKFLNHPMSSFVTLPGPTVDGPPAMSHPNIGIEYFNFMSGKWRDGSPLSYGGIGFDPTSNQQVNFLYPDTPTDPDGWSMYALDLSFWDFRAIANTAHSNVEIGQNIKLDMAHYLSHNPANDHIMDVDLSLQEGLLIQEYYDAHFESSCDFFTSVNGTPLPEKTIVYPNPTRDFINLETGTEFINYEIYDLLGASVRSGVYKTKIGVGDLLPGYYQLKLIKKDRTFQVVRFVKA